MLQLLCYVHFNNDYYRIHCPTQKNVGNKIRAIKNCPGVWFVVILIITQCTKDYNVCVLLYYVFAYLILNISLYQSILIAVEGLPYMMSWPPMH